MFGFKLPRSLAFAAERFASPLKVPALVEGNPGEGGKLFELGIQAGTSKFLPGVSTPTLGINGAYLGPCKTMVAGEFMTDSFRPRPRPRACPYNGKAAFAHRG